MTGQHHASNSIEVTKFTQAVNDFINGINEILVKIGGTTGGGEKDSLISQIKESFGFLIDTDVASCNNGTSKLLEPGKSAVDESVINLVKGLESLAAWLDSAGRYVNSKHQSWVEINNTVADNIVKIETPQTVIK